MFFRIDEGEQEHDEAFEIHVGPIITYEGAGLNSSRIFDVVLFCRTVMLGYNA